ncbi:MAG: hypothetical protein KKC80_08685, partial [Candidatus Margulisbacteria bacterium]|nr:hypothetical protein [Candidatus Margulisiibacteriota bacterium]
NNKAPSFDQSLTTQSFHHNQDLYYDINCSDFCSDVITYYSNNTMININNSNGTITDNPSQNEEGSYVTKVTCGDGIANTSQTFTYTIINDAPSLASATITPDPAVDADDLTCSVGSTSDTESDVVTIIYDWEKDGTPQGINNQLLDSANTSTGEIWRCIATPNDGFENGTAKYSQTVDIDSSTTSPVVNWANATTTLTGINSSSTNPTNNNSWVNLSVKITDPNTETWTTYFCENDIPSTTGCSGKEYCHTIENGTDKFPSCKLIITNESLSQYTFYAFTVDNTSLTSSTAEGSFEINHPPSKPVCTNPVDDVSETYTTLTFAANDTDSDIINYSIYTSTDGVTYTQQCTSCANYSWTGLSQSNTYYYKAYSIDQHNYTNYQNSTTCFFDVNYGEVLQFYPTTILYSQKQKTSNESFKTVFTLKSSTSNTYNISWTDTLPSDYFTSFFNVSQFTVQANNNYNFELNTTLNATIPVGVYDANITLTRISDESKWNVTVKIGVDPPSGLPQALDVFQTECAPTGVDYCDVSSIIDTTTSFQKTINITNIGQNTLTNCVPKMLGDIPGGYYTFSPNSFSLAQDNSTNLVYTISNLPSGNYFAWVDLDCIASATSTYNTSLIGGNNPIIELIVNQAEDGGGGGGGDNNPPIDYEEEVQSAIQQAKICGNGVCQEGENPLNCPEDCAFNVDELFCVLTDLNNCKAWVFNLFILIILGTILYVVYKRNKKGKGR